MTHLTRRRFLGVAGLAAGAGVLGLAGCGGSDSGGSGSTELQFAWWGNPERDKRTKAAIEAYQKKNSGVTIRPQITVWDSYWDKLATQTAGGNPPDLIQMDYAYITSYSDRGALLALDDYVPKTLQISDFDDTALAPGKVGGKLYGVSMGMNSWMMMANDDVIAQAKAEVPDDTLTWSGFADLARTIGKNTPDGVFGTQNGMFDGSNNPLECWLRQRGKALFADGGKGLGFAPDDLIEWFEFWEGLVKDGAAASPEVTQAMSPDLADGLVPTGKGAFQFAWSNQLTAYRKAAKGTVSAHTYPLGDGADAKPGQYFKASMFLSVSADSKSAEAAVKLANGLLTVPDIAGELGFERGYPPSQKVREAILPDASQPEKDSAGFIDGLKGKVGDTPPPPPNATAKVRQAMQYAFEQAGYNKASNKDAVDKFFNDAQAALSS